MADRFVFYLCNYALIWGVMYYNVQKPDLYQGLGLFSDLRS